MISFLKYAMIIDQKSLDVSLDSEKGIMIIIFIVLYWVLFLAGRSIYEKIKVNDVEQKTISWQDFLNKVQLRRTVPYFVGDFEISNKRNTINLLQWHSVESTVAKSVDVEMIRHGFSPPCERSDSDSIDNTNTEIITRNNGRGVYHRWMGKVRNYCF